MDQIKKNNTCSSNWKVHIYD